MASKTKSTTPKNDKPEKQKKTFKSAVKEGAKKLAAKAENSPVKKKIRAAKQAAKSNAVKENRLELLFTIVNRSKAEYYIDLLHSFDVNMQLVMLGHGTADASTLALFGLSDSDKAVIVSVIQESKIKDALATLEEKFQKIRNGKGIAYTVPMTSVIGTLIFGFLSDNRKAVKDGKEKQ